MIDWPKSLIEELSDRRVIIFIGSGIAASCATDDGVSPPNWKSLLSMAKDAFLKTDDDKTLAEQLISNELLLDAAEIIFSDVSQADRRLFFRDVLATPRFNCSEHLKLIQSINPKIVITTNYDQLYERQCDALVAGRGYSVRKYTDDKVLNDIRSKDNLIIKAHGCISETSEIILTRSDYFKIKRDHSQFYNVLDSLLTINTVLFLGCGMSDPDIQLVLENTNISAKSDHPHYAVIPHGKHPALKKAMEKAYNIKLLEYDIDANGDHSNLLVSLRELYDKVQQELELRVPR